MSSFVGLLRYAWQRWAPEGLRQRVIRFRAQLVGLGQLKINQAMLVKRVADLERGHAPAPGSPAAVPDDRFPAQVRSRLCTQAQLDEPWFARWSELVGWPSVANRKVWEFAYITEALDALGQFASGRRGLGFGVGLEPLPSVFASRGAQVMATDISSDEREAMGWAKTDQHAAGVDSMLMPEICDPATFRELVSWRPVDMRDIPSDLTGFDFCWSACSLEHLGTLAAGLEFVERSLSTLVPGGIAIHTTEYNVGSNDETVETGPCVVYRERDIREFVAHLEAQGHQVAALDLSPGEGLLDRYVDTPPYATEPALRFLFAGYTLTSVALVIRTRH